MSERAIVRLMRHFFPPYVIVIKKPYSGIDLDSTTTTDSRLKTCVRRERCCIDVSDVKGQIHVGYCAMTLMSECSCTAETTKGEDSALQDDDVDCRRPIVGVPLSPLVVSPHL